MASRDVDNRTLAVVWVCCILSILIMATRLILGRVFRRKFTLADGLTAAAIFLSFARIAFTHVIVLWKTSNIFPDLGSLDVLTQREIYEREIGGKLTVAARCLYIILLWLQKSVLLSFYESLVKDLRWGQRCVLGIWVVLGMTFIATITSTFTECRPFNHYWKVLAITDKCTEAVIQLFVVGALNLFTDILLLAVPIPILVKVRLDWKKKVQLSFIFSVGLVIIAVTAVRLPRTFNNATSETYRITWTTGEFLAATFVANAPTLYGYRRCFGARNDVVERSFNRSGSHGRGGSNLGGTTLTWGSELDGWVEMMDVEGGNEGRVDAEVEQSQRPVGIRKLSLAKVAWSRSADDEKD